MNKEKIRQKSFAGILFIFAFVMFWGLVLNVTPANAARKVICSDEAFNLKPYYEWDDESKDYEQFDFSVNSKKYVKLTIKIKAKGNIYDGGVRLKLVDSDGDVYANDYVSLEGYESGGYYEGIFYPDKYTLPAGDYTYKIINSADAKVNIHVSLYTYDSAATTFTMYSAKQVRAGSWVKIGKFPATQFSKFRKITCSDGDIVPNWEIDAQGNLWVLGWKKGTATVTVKLNNGKRYSGKVTVSTGDNNFFAQLTDYNTRNNYFTVRFKNVGPNSLTIYSANAKALDSDYKSYDRNLYISGKSYVTIAPGQSTTIKFKVSGGTTWYNYSDFTIRYYYSYGGTKYLGSTWSDGSSYKKSSGWFTTYWTSYEEDYENWLK